MITTRRVIDRRRIEPAAGPRLTLVAERWVAAVNLGGRSAALSYNRPARIEIDEGPVWRLVDHAMVLRIVSAAALVIALAIHRRIS